MTKAGSTNISRQKKKTDPHSSRGAAARAFFYIIERSFSTGRIYHTMHPPARTKPRLQWFHGLLSWGGKFALYLPLLLSQSACFAAGNFMTKKRARLTCDHPEELIYLHEVWPKVREWTAIKKARLVYWLHVVHTRANSHKHTHSKHKNPSGSYSLYLHCDKQ